MAAIFLSYAREDRRFAERLAQVLQGAGHSVWWDRQLDSGEEFSTEIEAEIDKVLTANADKVAEYRGGKDKLFGFFVGQTMKAMGGKANPAVVNEVLKTALGESVAS